MGIMSAHVGWCPGRKPLPRSSINRTTFPAPFRAVRAKSDKKRTSNVLRLATDLLIKKRERIMLRKFAGLFVVMALAAVLIVPMALSQMMAPGQPVVYT